jgi:hypothetical protein
MKQLYAWMSNLYNWELPKQEAKWIWSEKKKKYYAKFDTWEHMLILFKTWYLLVFNKEKRKWIIEPVRNYYHMIRDWVAYEVTPTFEIPF